MIAKFVEKVSKNEKLRDREREHKIERENNCRGDDTVEDICEIRNTENIQRVDSIGGKEKRKKRL